jgi:H/ACA ribonucleoprotein complex subunit 2
MGKEKSEKKEKKEKKEKRSEADGVKKSKKEKKDKKAKSKKQLAMLLNHIETEINKTAVDQENEDVADVAPAANGVKEVAEDVDMEDKVRLQIPKEALVPFANPLADDKQTKKVLRSVKKGLLTFLSIFLVLQPPGLEFLLPHVPTTATVFSTILSAC